MKYTGRFLDEWVRCGYNPIHLFGDYYLLRKYPKLTKHFSLYVMAKIRKRPKTSFDAYINAIDRCYDRIHQMIEEDD